MSNATGHVVAVKGEIDWEKLDTFGSAKGSVHANDDIILHVKVSASDLQKLNIARAITLTQEDK